MNLSTGTGQSRPRRTPWAWAGVALGSLAWATSAHGQTGVDLMFSFNVIGVCEVRSVAPPVVVLRCTRGFMPADPRAVLAPDLLPAFPMVWAGATSAPDGGTLNEYRVGPEAQPRQVGVARPEGWVEYY